MESLATKYYNSIAKECVYSTEKEAVRKIDALNKILTNERG